MSRPEKKPLKPVMGKVQSSPSGKKTKKVLISFLSYDQDSWKVKQTDASFMSSFYPNEPDRRPKTPEEIWRPSVALAQLFDLAKDYYPDGSNTPTAKGYKDLIFDDYYLLWDEREDHRKVEEEIESAIRAIIETRGLKTQLHVENPGIRVAFNTEDVYQSLFKYLSQDKFHEADTQYYVNCTNGTTQMRNCLFYFTQTGLIGALRIEPTPWFYHTQRNRKMGNTYPEDGKRWNRGSYVIDDPNDFGRAYEEIDAKKFQNDYLDTLQTGVTTKDKRKLQKIAGVIECINGITDKEFKAKQTILITGETGVGKTQLAQNIATAFGIDKSKFISVNCATIRGADPNIQRIELFGCKKGTVDGIDEDKDGALKKADGGLLFLDEIGELSPEMQAMLLTALDKGEFVPLGGDYADPQKSTFQLICGTNRPLEKAVEEGAFRRDLFNRINAWHFELDPLRKHLEDIQDNLKRIVREVSEKCGKKNFLMQPDAEKAFLEFSKTISWDGNFRELNAMITRMVILSRNEPAITLDIVKGEIKAAEEHYRRKRENGQDNQSTTQPPRPQEADVAPAETTTNEITLPPVVPSVIDGELYKNLCEKLSPVKKAELDVLIKLIQEEHITKQAELCSKVYCGSISANGGLSKHLRKKFGLRFVNGRLERI